MTAPPQFVPSQNGELVLNPDASVYHQQDKLLASWLLSTISGSLLSSFTGVRTSADVWTIANWMFAVVTGAKLSRLRHELHSVRKGTLTVKEDLSKIQNLCALIEASGHQISETNRVGVILAGLSFDIDVVVTLSSDLWTSWSSRPTLLLSV